MSSVVVLLPVDYSYRGQAQSQAANEIFQN